MPVERVFFLYGKTFRQSSCINQQLCAYIVDNFMRSAAGGH
jgi:hypothetical protein